MSTTKRDKACYWFIAYLSKKKKKIEKYNKKQDEN